MPVKNNNNNNNNNDNNDDNNNNNNNNNNNKNNNYNNNDNNNNNNNNNNSGFTWCTYPPIKMLKVLVFINYNTGFSPSNLVAHSEFEGIIPARWGTHLLHLGLEGDNYG